MIFIGKEYLTKENIARDTLLFLIKKYQHKGSTFPKIDKDMKSKAKERIKKRLEGLGIFTIISAGLVDGINPCAFATIVFFVSFLSFIGKKGKELLCIGIIFSIVVFFTYFLIGIGLLKVLTQLEVFSIIGKILFTTAGIGAIGFGCLSIYDYFKIKQGRISEMTLQLPRFVKERIHETIREKMKLRNYIYATIVVAFLISLSEFICTGQVYLPTILFVKELSSLKMKGIICLFIYNIAFILPLIGVFIAVYKGSNSKQIGEFFKKHIKLVKIGLGVIFFLLGGLLIFYGY
jgi:hypothetical protein